MVNHASWRFISAAGRATNSAEIGVNRRAGTTTVVLVMGSITLTFCAFVLMEPITYATHRWVMHGPGLFLHRSHHRPADARRWEANDWYPVAIAAVVIGALAIGFNVDGWGALIPIGVGITAYGVAYAIVHDGYVHRRLPWIGARRRAGFEQLAEAHRLHHRYGTEPYGMLLPIVPAAIRQRTTRDSGRAETGQGVGTIPAAD